MIPKRYTVEEVAEATRRTTRTVYRWIDERKIFATKVGKRYLFSESTIQKILSEGLK